MSSKSESKRSARLRRAAVTACEALEGRTLFAVTLVTDVDGNVGVQITGTAGNDNIVITEDPATGTATITGAGSAPTIPTGTDIRFFDISTFGGNDTVTFELASDYSTDANSVNDVRSIHADLGTGNDTFNFDTDGNAITAGSAVNLNVEGMSGNDTIDLEVEDVEGDSTLLAHLNGLDGNDRIDVDVDGVTGSSVDVNVYTGIGANTVNIDQGYAGAIGGGPASVEYTVRGDAGTDSVVVDLLDVITDALEVNAFLGGGNDKVAVNLGASFDASGGVSLNLNGGLGNDSMTVLAADDFTIGSPGIWADGVGASAVSSGSASLGISMQGSAGNDTLVVNLTGAGGSERVTLSDGNLKVRQAGEDGNDDIATRLGLRKAEVTTMYSVAPSVAYVTVGTVDARVTGDNGNDRVRTTLIEEESASPVPGIAYRGGTILFDGGAGTDTRDAFPGITGVPASFLRFDAKV